MQSSLEKKLTVFKTGVIKIKDSVEKQPCPQTVCVEVLRPSQPNGVMSSAVSLPNHTFTGQA